MPQPNLGIIADGVRQQIEARQAELERLRGRGDVPAGQLATAYGQLGMLYHTYRMFDAAEACYRNAQLFAPDVYRWAHYLGFLRQLTHIDTTFKQLYIEKDDFGIPHMQETIKSIQKTIDETVRRIQDSVMESKPLKPPDEPSG